MASVVPELERGAGLESTARAPARAWLDATRQEWGRGLVAVYAEHRLFALVVALQLLAGCAVSVAGVAPVIQPNQWGVGNTRLFLQTTPLWLFPLFVWHRLRTRTADGRLMIGMLGWRLAARRFAADVLTVERVGGTLLVCVLLTIAFTLNAGWKETIAEWPGFHWDARLSALGLQLHGGRYPYEWLQPVMGHPAVTVFLDDVYYAWFPLLMIGLLWQAWSADRELRRQFFLCHALVWVVLGTVLAHLFASAGPCYYGAVVGQPNPYQPLLDYLAQVDRIHPLKALEFQRIVWAAHNSGNDYWLGISALPSLHVAVPTLFACAGWRTNRWLGAAVAVYALLTLIGSVHLAWHYAIDGYVSVVAVLLLWWVSGKLVRWELGGRA
jgi:hypothetical protein